MYVFRFRYLLVRVFPELVLSSFNLVRDVFLS